MSDIDSILIRIAKLQALALDKGATSAEADLAASKIQELLNKYNLTMEQVKPIKDHTQRDVEFDTLQREGVRIFSWELSLLRAVTYATHCDSVYTSYAITFIGMANDVKACHAMYVNFRAVAQHLATQATKTYSDNVWDTRELRGSASLRTYRLNWLEGFANGLHAAFKKARYDATQINAIVLIKERLIKTAITDRYPKLGKTRQSNGQTNDSAYRSGYAEGKNTSRRKTLKGE